MPLKRSRSTSSFRSRAKRARRTGSMYKGQIGLGKKAMTRIKTVRLASKVNQLTRMIETKHFTWRTSVNVNLPHNDVLIVQQQSGGDLNIFRSALGNDDPMGVGGSRIGDSIAVRGVMIRAFFENALERSKVHYRVMLVRCAKGDTPNRANLFTSDSTNKMIDQVNNERFTIVAQKIFNIQSSNPGQAGSASLTGQPLTATTSGNWFGGQGTRTFKMWIPGYKFGNNGIVKFENASQTQVKFYDYRICIVVYDWYGTPQDVNNVGKINELYTKLYFKDA
jgi:hypothetical protein